MCLRLAVARLRLGSEAHWPNRRWRSSQILCKRNIWAISTVVERRLPAAVPVGEAVVAAIKTRLSSAIDAILRPAFHPVGSYSLFGKPGNTINQHHKIGLIQSGGNPDKHLNRAQRSLSGISPVLQALTTAALMLPGMSTARAADDEVTIQYGHYEEAKRDTYGRVPVSETAGGNTVFGEKKLPNIFAPITVDSIHVQGKTTLRDRWKFTANYSEDTWSGATPIATAPAGFGTNFAYALEGAKHNPVDKLNQTVVGASPRLQDGFFPVFDSQLNPVFDVGLNDAFEESYQTGSNRLAHTMTMASPETRKQGDFKLGYEWDEAAVDLGGGLSVENDYESRFVNWGGRLDFNNKLTTLNFSQSYTNSTVSALLDHDSVPFLSTTGYELNGKDDNGYIDKFQEPLSGVNKKLHGKREDIATNFSLTQVLNKSALAEAGVGYTHSSGFMENPYKATYVFFVDPSSFDSVNDVFTTVSTTAFTEQRPNKRNQVNLNLRYVQHVEPLDAAMNLKYNYFFDDWGINAHTFEGKWIQPLPWGLTVTPTIRYYSQSAADFYHPYLALRRVGSGSVNRDVNEADYRAVVQQYPNFSSDHRLSAYGALSGGVIVNKQFARGLNLEMGFEYYTHQGGLRLGGGGESGYADFSAYSANAALKVNLDTLGRSLADSGGSHHHHHHQHAPAAPAGLMFDHMLNVADDWMIGYQYMYGKQAGNLLQGTQSIADSAITLNNAVNNPNCAGEQCYVAPTDMTMHMHMFMVMYAPTDWLNLMLMPTFMDMGMNMRQLAGTNPPSPTDVDSARALVGSAVNHAGHEHQTGGIGDTNISALVKLYDDKQHHLHLGLGVSAPTGDVDIHLRPTHGFDLGFIHYGMQLGSGTWDFTPTLTYTGHHDDWGWGAQLQGIKRLQNQNESGYRLGDMLQATAWGSYRFLDWLGGTVRGIYTTQDSLHGEYDGLHVPIGTMDTPANHGGKYWDIGMGLNATIPGGDLAGNTFSVEWIQPLQDNVNGVQLEREGALSAKWSYMF